MSRRIDKTLLLFLITAVFTSGCTKKVEYVNHLKHTTLKLAPAVRVSIKPLQENKQQIVLRPVFDTQKSLENIKITWLLALEDQPAQVIFEQDLSREPFSESRLQDVHVPVTSTALNHKVVLMVSGKSDGTDFNLTAIYNSLFQKEIDEAKDRLLERSSRKVIRDKREYQD
ncbi:MAG: hypothetical protein M9899_01820 [Bdellovibrionaceae bacterium]|nr:hypothetical protein [Pseudobdellovibrionaceae bacterium]